MFKVLLPDYNVTISIDSNDPDVSEMIEFEGDDPKIVETIREQVDNMHGIYGHMLCDCTTPLDLHAGLVKSIYEFQILEGAEILKMPRQQLPPGAKRSEERRVGKEC